VSTPRDGRDRGTRSGSPGTLGEFLRSRRGSLEPEVAGLRPDLRRRQVRGLRREELAELAGVSVDYYTRLEQGRERHPSDQVLDSLARTLRLSADEAGHLFRLARPIGALAEPQPAPAVGPDVLGMINAQLRVPVAVLGPALDVLALNPVGVAFYSGFTRTNNLLQMIFCDPVATTFFDDWELTARATIASVRATSAQFPRHRRIAEVVAELTEASPAFAALWTTQEIKLSPCVETHLLRHPRVGELYLYCSTLAIVAAPGQSLHVFSPVPGSESAARLELLAQPG
jgi:transcriptional regulator with XRE-family HTH domain